MLVGSDVLLAVLCLLALIMFTAGWVAFMWISLDLRERYGVLGRTAIGVGWVIISVVYILGVITAFELMVLAL